MFMEKQKKTVIGKIVGKAVQLALAATLGLTGCGMLPLDDAGIENIQFNEINTKWTQEEVNSKVKLAVSQLSTQSQTIKDQYISLESELRSELNNKGDNYNLLARIGFAKDV